MSTTRRTYTFLFKLDWKWNNSAYNNHAWVQSWDQPVSSKSLLLKETIRPVYKAHSLELRKFSVSYILDDQTAYSLYLMLVNACLVHKWNIEPLYKSTISLVEVIF